jgi:uncharacterized protein (TIGR02145 family)
MKKILIAVFGGIRQKAAIILILTGVLQICKAQTGSIIINKNNNAGTITRQVDSSGYSTIWNFNKTTNGWASTINYTVSNPCPGTPTVYYAGQTYHTVQIGSQCWLVENLNVGTMINVKKSALNNGIIEKYCFNDDSVNCATYGGLYQWAEALQYQNGVTNTDTANPPLSGNIQGICPGGWHIPTYYELDTLGAAVNQNSNALKAIGQGVAIPGATAGTNISGFSAMFGGSDDDGAFELLGYFTDIWSSTESSTTGAGIMHLIFNFSFPTFGNDMPKHDSFSVRCVKD